MTFPTLTTPAQANAPDLVNEAFETLEPSAAYGKKHATTTGLTWGYHGVRWGGSVIADNFVTLGGSTTTYLVVERATGLLTAATSTTNWNNTTDYARVYKIVTGASTVTGTPEDHRQGPGGVLHGGGAGGASIISPWKEPVRAASTANGTLASAFENGDSLDGVTLATGNRILLKNQTTASENGIYVVAATGAPARSGDANGGDEMVGAVVFVSEGTVNADRIFKCTTNATITLGSTSVVFAEVGADSSNTVTALSIASGVVNIDWSLSKMYTLALTANVTSITFSNLPGSGNGGTKLVVITQDSTPRTVAWPASFKWKGGVAGVVSTGSGVVDLLAISTPNNGTSHLADLANDYA